MDTICGIYGLLCKSNNKWYVGQSKDILTRFEQYKKVKCKSQKKLYYALLKYGFENFETKIIETCSPELLDEREMFWIKEYDCIANGYNITIGGNRGGNRKGMKNSPLHRQRISQALMGFKYGPQSAERRLAKSLATRGRPGTIPGEETRKKLSLSHMGHNLGTHWITNGIINKRTKEILLPEGWRMGKTWNRNQSNTAE